MQTHPTLRRAELTLALLGAICLGCCPAWRSGAEGVRIAGQEILVYYDAEKGVEHFVRRADFYSSAQDFGFLVPTPTQPRLSETADGVFDRLAHAIKPEIQRQTRYRPSFVPLLLMPLLMSKDSLMAPATDAAAIEVLDTAFVGGFEAAVLRADDVEALLAWLEENGYDARADLKEWLQPYIDKQWIVTAFKFDPDAQTRSVSTKAVCLSFATDAPFFPYRVPRDQLAEPGKGSLLRVYYVGDERVAGSFENSDQPWPGRTRFSNAIADPAALLEGVGGEEKGESALSFPQRAWLTAFEDKTWPGGTDDLYFTAAKDPAAVIPPPIIRSNTVYVPIPADVILAGVGLVIFLRRRKRRRESPKRVG